MLFLFFYNGSGISTGPWSPVLPASGVWADSASATGVWTSTAPASGVWSPI